jgi:hypothetical protein
MLLAGFTVFFDGGFGVLRVDEPARRAAGFEATLFATFFLLVRFLAAAFLADIALASKTV